MIRGARLSRVLKIRHLDLIGIYNTWLFWRFGNTFASTTTETMITIARWPKRGREDPQITLFFVVPTASSQASWSFFCDCVWQLLSAISLSISFFQRNLASFVCNSCLQFLFATPFYISCFQLLLAITASKFSLQSVLCNSFLQGVFATLVSKSSSQLLFASAFCNFCFQLLLQLLFCKQLHVAALDSNLFLQLFFATPWWNSSLQFLFETPSGSSLVCSGFRLPSSQVFAVAVVAVGLCWLVVVAVG